MEATFVDNANNIVYHEAAVEIFLSIMPRGWAENKNIVSPNAKFVNADYRQSLMKFFVLLIGRKWRG